MQGVSGAAQAGRARRAAAERQKCRRESSDMPYSLSRKAQLFLERFERIVDDGAVAGAVDELPHSAGNGAGAADHVRKSLAGLGTLLVDRAGVAIEEDAPTVRGAAQDSAFFRALGGVFGEELCGLDPQEACQALHVALGDGSGGDSAAVRALGAIDLLFDLFGDAAQNAVGVVACFHVAPEAFIFGALLFAEETDLDEIGDHGCCKLRRR